MPPETRAKALIAAAFSTTNQFRKALIVVGTSIIHVAAHVVVAIIAARCFAAFNQTHFTLQGEWYSVWKWLCILFLEMSVVGFFAGGTIFGLNMLITCRWLRMNRNDAFSALRIGRFNNFRAQSGRSCSIVSRSSPTPPSL